MPKIVNYSKSKSKITTMLINQHKVTSCNISKNKKQIKKINKMSRMYHITKLTLFIHSLSLIYIYIYIYIYNMYNVYIICAEQVQIRGYHYKEHCGVLPCLFAYPLRNTDPAANIVIIYAGKKSLN